jgi:plasmid stability protein
MPKTLTIQLPDDLHARLERQAQTHQRSLDEEVVRLLDETVETDVDRDALWERIRRRREEGPTIDLDPAELKEIMRRGLA